MPRVDLQQVKALRGIGLMDMYFGKDEFLMICRIVMICGLLFGTALLYMNDDR